MSEVNRDGKKTDNNYTVLYYNKTFTKLQQNINDFKKQDDSS